jgi:hypothetical protein
MGGIGRNYLAGNQPVKKHPYTCEVLLDGGSRPLTLQLLDVCGDVHRLHVCEAADPLPLTPVQEGGGGSPISSPGIWIADVDRKELDKAPRGPFPSLGDQGGEHRPGRNFYGGQLIHLPAA